MLALWVINQLTLYHLNQVKYHNNLFCLHCNIQIMWFYLILLTLLLAVIAYIYGVFTPVTTYKDKLLSPHLIYYSFRGSKHQLSAQFDRIKTHTEQFFKLSTCFGIYYTHPSQAIWECVLGFQVNEGETNNAAAFLRQHQEYKEAKLKSTRYVGCTLPYINELSFMVNIYKINQFFQVLKKDEVEIFKGLIQRYNFIPTFGKTVELMNPIDNSDQWNLL